MKNNLMKAFMLMLLIITMFSGCVSGTGNQVAASDTKGQTAVSIEGDYTGGLSANGQSLPIVFHIRKNGSVFDSPEQGAFGIPFDTTYQVDNTITLVTNAAGAKFVGTISDDGKMIVGVWSQQGMDFELILSSSLAMSEDVSKTSETVDDVYYISKDIIFENKKAGISLAGTLTIPEGEGPFTAVVLVSGSGPQNRDEELMGHKPFFVIADYLTKKGIAVLRYDDRGIGESGGNFNTATSNDFADDASAAVDYLITQKEVAVNKIGIAGHSEGGMIAPMVGSKRGDVDFIISLAGIGLSTDEILYAQKRALLEMYGTSATDIDESLAFDEKAYDILKADSSIEVKKQKITELAVSYGITQGSADFKTLQNTYFSPWFLNFITVDPGIYWEKVSVPVLAVNGSKDLQVIAGANLKAIEESLQRGGNDQVTVKEFIGLNHLFQTAGTGLPDEYGSIEETFNEEVLEYISRWIVSLK